MSHMYPQATVGEFEHVRGVVDSFLNPAYAAGWVGAWAVDKHVGSRIAPQFGVANVVDIPADYGMNIHVLYTRRTRTGRRAPDSAPPQAFEGDPDMLAGRLIDEGADPEAVAILRRWIFVRKVTEQALEAPVESRELSRRHGGVRVKWRLLLQVVDAAPGEQSYCCRLCPRERRPEYKNAPDVLRHLKRDHFGISVACQYWSVPWSRSAAFGVGRDPSYEMLIFLSSGHKFFRRAEMYRHTRGCKRRPAGGL